MIKRLVDCSAIDRTDVSLMKALDYGGAPMMVEDLRQAMAKIPNMVQIYGLGETPMTITYLPQRDHVLNANEAQTKRLASARMTFRPTSFLNSLRPGVYGVFTCRLSFLGHRQAFALRYAGRETTA